MALSDLPDWHVDVLQWFSVHAGEFFEKRPIDVGLSRYVTSPQGPGIWKPNRRITGYALSIYQSWKGTYPDQPPIEWGDGQWSYIYHQEGPTSEDPYVRGTNRGLMACWADGIPVGVLLPEKRGRVKGYRVLGLALIDDRTNGCFVVTGPVSLSGVDSFESIEARSGSQTVSLITLDQSPFDPDAEVDSRQRVVAEVVRRQGQPQFRRVLLDAYDRQCCVTGFDADPALEAAHIIQYRGTHSNHPENGLLLRADIHDLFDLGLVGVSPADMSIVCAPDLAATRYAQLDGQRIRLPRDTLLRPNERALQKHLEMAGLAS